MQVPADADPPPNLDIETLESNSTPIFVIRVSTAVLRFEILYANRAFRTGGFHDAILADNREALLFRSWAQALGRCNAPQPEFAGWRWSAEVASRNGTLKLIRVVESTPAERHQRKYHDSGVMNDVSQLSARSLAQQWSTEDYAINSNNKRTALPLKLPHINLEARYKVMQAMMEMSDVGVFEFNAEGKLLHGNKAWYRLRSSFLGSLLSLC
jgi:hypothetical protein